MNFTKHQIATAHYYYYYSTFNVTRTQSNKDHTLFTAMRQCWTVSTAINKTTNYTAIVLLV